MTDFRLVPIVPDSLFQIRGLAGYTDQSIRRRYRKGEIIALPGEEKDCIVYIAAGKVSIYFVEDSKQALILLLVARACAGFTFFGFRRRGHEQLHHCGRRQYAMLF
ncbi:MAG: cyclic nucleotide-binding domain-containing protein [Gracilibacteraceae bacterium]|jgi:CRP-like cAMP-binding protein|nr:cyclic nucleotide-binding domain-containing protein [Gracilibacteraceae bacterium]